MIEVGASYAANIDDLTKRLREVIAADKRIQPDPKPIVGISKLSETAMTVLVEVWVGNADLRTTQFDSNRRVKEVLASMGVAAPMAPQRIAAPAPPDTGTPPKP